MSGLIANLKSHNFNTDSTLLNYHTIADIFIYNNCLQVPLITILIKQ